MWINNDTALFGSLPSVNKPISAVSGQAICLGRGVVG